MGLWRVRVRLGLGLGLGQGLGLVLGSGFATRLGPPRIQDPAGAAAPPVEHRAAQARRPPLDLAPRPAPPADEYLGTLGLGLGLVGLGLP